MRDIAYDQLLVIDLEATCWDNKFQRPSDQQSEIIEIGICTLDLNTLVIDNKKSILVKPRYSKVSEFCTWLTGHTQDELDSHGIYFEDACNILRKEYKSKKRAWVSWGDYDKGQFDRNAQMYLIETPPVSKAHLNLKRMFSIVHGHPNEIGMEGALNILKMDLIGRHHNGADDAYNAARIAATILAPHRK